uniref:Uncharacterized protein n=1 Tax=Arundo donax TaxID=35708 RepID=A0A0A9AMR7_ARUDO
MMVNAHRKKISQRRCIASEEWHQAWRATTQYQKLGTSFDDYSDTKIPRTK